MTTNQAQLTQTISIGGPNPIHPTALPTFTKGVNLDGLFSGFTSKGSGSSASGVILGSDDFSTV